MKVQRGGVRFGQEQWRELLHPPGKEPLLLVALSAVRVVGGEALLGQDIQAGKQSERLLEVEVVDVAATFFVQELQCEQTEQCGIGGDHLRSRVAGFLDQAVKPQTRQQRQEQKEPRDARSQAQGVGRREDQFPAVRHVGRFFLIALLVHRQRDSGGRGRTSDLQLLKKGEASPELRQCWRNS